MRKRIITAAILMATALLLALPLLSGADNAGGSPKLKAEQSLKGVLPDVKILSIEPASIGDLWEVGFESRGEKGVVYLDQDMEFILVGSLINLKSGENITKQKFNSISKVDFSSIPLKDSLVLGSRKAKHKVVVFDDPD